LLGSLKHGAHLGWGLLPHRLSSGDCMILVRVCVVFCNNPRDLGGRIWICF
jgi:hypothetical protein